MRVLNTRPVDPRRAIMTARDDRRLSNTFRGTACESCGAKDGTVVGAHFNFEHFARGLKARGIQAGLCDTCHSLADGRTNAPWEERMKIWLRVLSKVLRERSYERLAK